MGLEFHVGESAWEELKEEFERVVGEEEAVLILGIGLAGMNAEEHEHRHEGEHIHVETPFVKAVKRMAREVEGKLGAKAHFHLHPNSGSVTFVLEVKGSELVERFNEIIEISSKWGECVLTGLEGEVRVGEELAALLYGSPAKASFILPNADGKRLKVIEVLLTS